MSLTTIILIGALGVNGKVYDGETMKNLLFKNRFTELGANVITINTTRWNKRPWVFLSMAYNLIFNLNAKVVISACDKSAYFLIRFLYYFRVKKNIYYWVVGGGLDSLVSNGTLKTKYYRYLKKILVQSPIMSSNLSKCGLNNSEYIPNSKIIYEIKTPIKSNPSEPIKFVFVSRILGDKGVDLIVKCASRLKSEGFKLHVDFFGKDNGYPDFKNRIANLSFLNYKGIIDLTCKKGYEELSQYDVFLFPTYYANEGFPGVLIDSFISGLPIITTNWNYNKEIVTNHETGIIIKPKDEESLYSAMKFFLQNPIEIEKMRVNCLIEAKRYDIKNILSKEKLSNLGII